MASISIPAVVAGGISAVGAVAGGAISGSAAQSAARTQAAAADRAAQLQASEQDQVRSDLLPYNIAGQSAENTLQGQLAYLTSPTTMDEATLKQTPGYQFNLSQGLESTQNAAAARGLGVSGAALKGAATYATGLADSTYQNQFNNDQTNKASAYNKLMGIVQTGESAAAQTGSLGTTSAANQGNNLTSAANASAAGTVSAANSASSALSGVGNSAMSYLMMSKLLGGSGGNGPIDNGSW